jgi:hypothetical protein
MPEKTPPASAECRPMFYHAALDVRKDRALNVSRLRREEGYGRRQTRQRTSPHPKNQDAV